MRVSVKFLGHLREELGGEESYDLFGDSGPHSLAEILGQLIERKGESWARRIYEGPGRFTPHITVIVDGRAVLNDQAAVQDGSSVLFIPFVDGG